MAFIIVNILETKLYTCGLIDIGLEITILKNVLLNDCKDTKIYIKGVTRNKEKIAKQKGNVEIMIQNKIKKIGKVYQYDKIERDIILGNDFVSILNIPTNDLYYYVQNPCYHWIKVPRIFKPFKINYDQNTKK